MTSGRNINVSRALPGPGLAGFLTLSLLLHAVVIAASSWLAPTSLATHPLGERRLVVELGDITVTARPRHDRKPTEPDAARSPSTVPDTGGSTSGAPSINHLLGDIQTRLSRYLSYPPLARTRGWQGTVTVGFDLVPDGRLRRIHVTRSSGYDVLDRAAVDALARVERLDGNGIARIDAALAMRLPVIYRLTER